MSLYNRLTQRNVPVAGPNPNMTPMTRKPMGLRDALQKYADGGDVEQENSMERPMEPQFKVAHPQITAPPEKAEPQIPDPYGGYTPVSPPNPREDLTTLVQQAIRGTADKQVTLDDLQEQFPNVPKETLAAIAADFERQRQEARDRYYAANPQVQSPLPPVLPPNQPLPQPSPYDANPQPQYVATPINVPLAYPEPQYAVPPQPYTVMPQDVANPVPNFAPPEAQPNYGPQFVPPEAQPNYGPQVAAAQPNYGPQPASTSFIQNILGASRLGTGLPGSGINKPTTIKN